MRTTVSESALSSTTLMMTLSISLRIKSKMLVFLRAYFWNATKYPSLKIPNSHINGVIWTLASTLMFTAVFSELSIAMNSHAASTTTKASLLTEPKNTLMIHSLRPDKWLIWNSPLLILLNTRTTLKWCLRVADLTRTLTHSFRTIERYFHSISSGKIAPTMVETSTTFSTIFSQTTQLKSRKLMSKITAKLHSQCCWNAKSWPRPQSWPIAQACHLEKKSSINPKTWQLARRSTSMVVSAWSTTLTPSLVIGSSKCSIWTWTPFL